MSLVSIERSCRVDSLLILRSRHYIKCRSSISPAVLPFAPRLQCVSVRVSDAWQLRCFHHVHRVKVQAWRDGRLSFHPVGEAADGDLLSLYHIFTSAPLRKCFCFFLPPCPLVLFSPLFTIREQGVLGGINSDLISRCFPFFFMFVLVFDFSMTETENVQC